MQESFQLKISLAGSQPLIWRRLVVPAHISIEELHEVFQIVMGWRNRHLWSFETMVGNISPAQATVPLNTIVQKAGDTFNYIYDFGDHWQHKIKVEKILENTKGMDLLDGEHACPPEDCGGIWGYADLIEILEDSDHPAYSETIESMGDFDYTLFDKVNVAKQLREVMNYGL